MAVAATVAAAAHRAASAQSAPPPPRASEDPQYRTVAQLVEALAARKVSAVELLEASLKRIATLDPHINAVVVRDFDRARAAAKAADEALARGERRPLLGVPMTVKESYDVAGLPTTWGIPAFKDWRPAEDAVVVSRLKAAGAVVLGKTNVPVGLADWQTINPIHGRTNNPHDIDRTPGGSSGGAAAALACGYVALEMGSDIGGSLRTPAHFTGVYGHKPSHGIVPERGHTFPRAVPTASGNGLSVVGPMARSAADIATALDIVAGADERAEGVAWKVALPPARHTGLAGFRVLVLDSHPLAPVAKDIAQAFDRLAGRLAKSGAKVARASPLLPDLAEATRNFVRLLSPVLAQGRPPEYYERVRAAAAAMPADDPGLDALWLRSINAGWREWRAADIVRDGMRRRWRALFQEFDAVVCPAMPTLAFPHDASDVAGRRLDIDGAKHPYIVNLVWAGFATAAGLPATVAPIDRGAGGLPIGAQIVGPMLEDRTPIALAALMEREYGGFVPPVL
ncbi:MAG: amidase [Rhodospirillales bacterium]|nr:MAG: amidase [Rhodospirillales bacterium]